MSDLGGRWRSLSRPWKTFVVSFVVLVVFFVWLLGSPVMGAFAAAVWASVLAGTVRLFDRARHPPWR